MLRPAMDTTKDASESQHQCHGGFSFLAASARWIDGNSYAAPCLHLVPPLSPIVYRMDSLMVIPIFYTMDRPTIIYDGECRFCQWSLRRIRKLDRREQFEYLPRQADGVDARFPILAQSDFDTGLRLISGDGDVQVGADAVYAIYRQLPPYHLVAWTYRVPVFHQLFKAGYGLIARNRHRFGRTECDTGVCDVPVGARAATSSNSPPT